MKPSMFDKIFYLKNIKANDTILIGTNGKKRITLFYKLCDTVLINSDKCVYHPLEVHLLFTYNHYNSTHRTQMYYDEYNNLILKVEE